MELQFKVGEGSHLSTNIFSNFQARIKIQKQVLGSLESCQMPISIAQSQSTN